MTDKIRATHLERKAVVYLRQSSLNQVREHRESTARQYALRERAMTLGWSADTHPDPVGDRNERGARAASRQGRRDARYEAVIAPQDRDRDHDLRG